MTFLVEWYMSKWSIALDGTIDSTSIGANPYNMNMSLTSSDVSCSGATNGSVQVNVNGGALPYSYQYYQDTLSNNVIIEDGAESGVSNFVVLEVFTSTPIHF